MREYDLGCIPLIVKLNILYMEKVNNFFTQKILGLSFFSFLPLLLLPFLPFNVEEEIIEDCTLHEITLDTFVVSYNIYDVEHIVIKKGQSRDTIMNAYKELFIHFANVNNLRPEQVATLFFYESGGYNRLWRLGKNPFSIKAESLGKEGVMYAKDDCGDIPCKFSTYTSIRNGFDDLARLLNVVYPDYRNKTNKEFFVYLKSIGYHSDNSQYIRANYADKLAKKYFT